jgi:CDP-ribitol ribitolphosphotransferase
MTKAVIGFVIAIARVFNTLLRLLPVRRTVVFLSRQSDTPSRDFTMLADEIRELDPSIGVVTRCRMVPSNPVGRLAYGAEALAQMYHLATSRVCVIDGYIMPVSVLDHRDSLTVIQMWHALGAIKRFGHQAIDRPGGRPGHVARALRMHCNYDLVLCGGEGAIPAFSEAFGVDPSRVMPLGLPRVDFLSERGEEHDAVLARLTTLLPGLNETSKPRVLYAPTFRRHGATGYAAVTEAFDAERFTLVVKPHDLEAGAVHGSHAIDASGVDVLDLLHACDAVVTDYSAVAFEAAAAEVPVYFYVFDIDEYEQAHGLNLDPIAEFGADASRDAGALAERIAAGTHDAGTSTALTTRFLPADRHGCTRSIAELCVAKVGMAR